AGSEALEAASNRVRLGPVNDQRSVIQRFYLAHDFDGQRVRRAKIRRGKDLPGEDIVVGGVGSAVVPDQVGPQSVGRLHPSVGKDLPAVGVQLGQRLREIGQRIRLIVQQSEICVEDPLGKL